MCMLFMCTGACCGDYRLVVANNRDELWARPTATAAIRKHGDHSWIGGMDLEPGREGGTWLGISTSGRIACLLNIKAPQKAGLLGRGFLVRDFLTSSVSVADYLHSISTSGDQYNPFHLFVADLRQDNPIPQSISCHYGEPSVINTYRNEVLGCDNSTSIERPWNKRIAGQQRFSQILQNNNSIDKKESLIDELLEMLNDKTRTFPDDQLALQFASVGASTSGHVIEERSALNVFSPSFKYGTRTRTVLLVDQAGNCDYIERTLASPVNVDNPEWTSVRHSVKIDL